MTVEEILICILGSFSAIMSMAGIYFFIKGLTVMASDIDDGGDLFTPLSFTSLRDHPVAIEQPIRKHKRTLRKVR